MALNETIINKTNVEGSKSFTLTAGQKIALQIDGVDDSDLTYTVPAGKTLTITTIMSGQVQ